MPIFGNSPIEPIKPIVQPAVDVVKEIVAPLPIPGGGSDDYPPDSADSNIARWFLPAPAAQAGNDVTTYPYARELWIAMREEIEKTAANSMHFIYIIGRNLGMDTDMEIGAPTPVQSHMTLGKLLTAAAAKDVQVRALLSNLTSNRPATDFINGLANGNGAAFQRHNHQKILVVSNRDGLVAFCGGVDIDSDRANWHDVHCRIRGPAAQKLHDIFVLRWQANKQPQKLLPPPQSQTAGDKQVQVVRTFPKQSPESSGGEHTIYDLIANAIAVSKRFIYVEDQYLVENTAMHFGGKPVSTLLADKLRDSSFERLIILIARTEWLNRLGEFGDVDGNPGPRQGWSRRRKFISELQQADYSKVNICTYKANTNLLIDGNYPVHIHSKTWIFDDSFAIFGSANCHRAGYTFLPEADVGVADENVQANRPFFAHELRVGLWLKHLNGSGSTFKKSDVADFLKAADYWKFPPPGALFESYDPDGDKNLQNPKNPNNGAMDSSSPAPYSDWDTAWDAADKDGS